MFVVVYLTAPKGKIILPQDWLKDFNQETVNNIGKASYQNRRIFWSKIGVDADGIPDSSIRPNFNRNKSLVFPPSSDDACYDARVLCYRPHELELYIIVKHFDRVCLFCTMFKNSLKSRCRQCHRIIKMQIVFQPTHNLSQSPDHQLFTTQLTMKIQALLRLTPLLEILKPEQEVQDSLNQSADESLPFDETKYVMPNVELDDTDLLEISHVFHDEQTNDQQARNSTPELNDNESMFLENGVMKIKKVVDDDYEMVYIYGIKITPYVGFEVKLNDSVSMNIPFNENVSSPLQSM